MEFNLSGPIRVLSGDEAKEELHKTLAKRADQLVEELQEMGLLEEIEDARRESSHRIHEKLKPSSNWVSYIKARLSEIHYHEKDYIASTKYRDIGNLWEMILRLFG